MTHLDVRFVPFLDSKAMLNGRGLRPESNQENAGEVAPLSLRLITAEDWQPLLLAAQSGNMQATEDAFDALCALLPMTRAPKVIRSAIETI